MKGKTLTEIMEDYATEVEKNAQKYVENAQKSANKYAKHFAPFYLRQLAASLATEQFEGYTRFAAYGLLMMKYGREAKRQLEEIKMKELEEQGLKVPRAKLTEEKIEKAVAIITR